MHLRAKAVSILVLMDFRLKVCGATSGYMRVEVSILVLMDFRLKASGSRVMYLFHTCFNPCSNGLSAQRISR